MANPQIPQVEQSDQALKDNGDSCKAGLIYIAGFTLWDECARGAALAVDENKLNGKVRIYSADISTPDIAAMRAPGSAWAATAAWIPK